MADLDIQISGLPSITSLQPSDLFVVKRGTLDYKVTFTNLFGAHTTDTSNPHSVTKSQVGLGNVTNDAQLKIASNLSDLTNLDAARTTLNVFTKPEVISQINTQHANLTNNPHNVTKEQVGLGNLQNWVQSTNFLENTDNKYATIGSVFRAHGDLTQAISASITNHLAVSNPHNITKATISLENVQNFGISNSFGLDSATSYASSKALRDGIIAVRSEIIPAVNSHANLTNNPHNVTKAQVGLGNVFNYSISDSYTSNSSDVYASSKAVRDGLSSLRGEVASNLAVHTSREDNPHSVTKAQVGLGNVPNYTISNATEDNVATSFASSKAVRDALAAARMYADSVVRPDDFHVFAGVGWNSLEVAVGSDIGFDRGWNNQTHGTNASTNARIENNEIRILETGLYDITVDVICERNGSALGILTMKQDGEDRAVSVWKTDEEGEQVVCNLSATLYCAVGSRIKVTNQRATASLFQFGVGVTIVKK